MVTRNDLFLERKQYTAPKVYFFFHIINHDGSPPLPQPKIRKRGEKEIKERESTFAPSKMDLCPFLPPP